LEKLSDIKVFYKLDDGKQLTSVKKILNKIYFTILENSNTYFKTYNIDTNKFDDIINYDDSNSKGIYVIGGIE
jgi:hypothetical protein